MFRALVLLLSVALSMNARTLTDPNAVDLTSVRRIEVRAAQKDQLDDLKKAIVLIVPGVTVVSDDQADLVIEYREDVSRGNIAWHARLLRLDCQSSEFGVPGTKPWEGRCDEHVYVRVDLGWLNGNVNAGDNSLEAFASALKQAILFPAPLQGPPEQPWAAPKRDFVVIP